MPFTFTKALICGEVSILISGSESFLCLGEQLDRPVWAGIQADVAIPAALDIQVGGLARVGLHDGARLANLQGGTLLASLAEIEIDADTDFTRHDNFAEYTRIISNKNLLTGEL